MSVRKKYEERLSEIVVSDKKDNINGLNGLIKAEIMNVLRSYFVVSNDDVDIDIWAESEVYKLGLNANIRGIKKIKKII